MIPSLSFRRLLRKASLIEAVDAKFHLGIIFSTLCSILLRRGGIQPDARTGRSDHDHSRSRPLSEFVCVPAATGRVSRPVSHMKRVTCCLPHSERSEILDVDIDIDIDAETGCKCTGERGPLVTLSLSLSAVMQQVSSSSTQNCRPSGTILSVCNI